VKGRWVRRGPLAIDTSRASSWVATHAALPVPEPIGDGQWNVYLSLRDPSGRARIGRALFTMDPTPSLAPLEPEPVLDLGERGTFDDSGVVTSCLVSDGDRRYLFYTGWSRGLTVPFYLGAGLAVSVGGQPFGRMSRAPILDRSDAEPFLTASPFVLHDDGRWRMWYVSGIGWVDGNASPEPCYNIWYAESDDAVHWERSRRACLEHGPGEHAFGRPWIVRDHNRYCMWFSARGERYWISYAESPDGIAWTRHDEKAGLRPSSDGWDSEMVEYPCLIEHRGRRYMLYNGNDYGRTGIGLAVWESDSAGER
jgi:hypothetical protein